MAYKKSKEELEKDLELQLDFLERSANAYDNGYKGEAVRLAGPLAILLHDNAKSQGVSLLKQLGKKNRNFFDTAMPYNPKNQMSHEGLLQMDISADAESTFIAPLDEPIRQTFTPFDDWWNAKILVDKEGRELTRKSLVKSIRDQDGGGGHIDPELNDDYAQIAKNYSLGWEISDGKTSEPIPGAEKASIRQIAHEVLKTLIPNYEKSRPDTDGTIVGGTASFKVPEGQNPKEFMKDQQTFTKEVEPGRNDPCPCGSGRKYKHCCL